MVIVDICGDDGKIIELKYKHVRTRRSGRYAPILLALTEGWGPLGPLGALRALLRSKSRKFSIFTQGCLVPIFTTRGVVAPPGNNLIMSATSIRSFRHLECQNPSIISESIGIPNGSEKMGKK